MPGGFRDITPFGGDISRPPVRFSSMMVGRGTPSMLFDDLLERILGGGSGSCRIEIAGRLTSFEPLTTCLERSDPRLYLFDAFGGTIHACRCVVQPSHENIMRRDVESSLISEAD